MHAQPGTTIGVAALLALWPAADNRLAAAAPATRTVTAWAGAPPLAEGPAGERLLVEYQCGACHRIDGVSGATGTRGPSLVAFGRRSYIAGRVPNSGPLLARWIEAPQTLVPGTAMPALGVPPERARLMAAWLHGR